MLKEARAYGTRSEGRKVNGNIKFRHSNSQVGVAGHVEVLNQNGIRSIRHLQTDSTSSDQHIRLFGKTSYVVFEYNLLVAHFFSTRHLSLLLSPSTLQGSKQREKTQAGQIMRWCKWISAKVHVVDKKMDDNDFPYQ